MEKKVAKIILVAFAIMMSIVGISYAQGEEVQQAVSAVEAVSDTDKVIQAIERGLSKAGDVGQYAFEKSVRYTRVSAISSICISLTAFFLFLIASIQLYKRWDEDSDYEGPLILTTLITVVFLIVSLAVLVNKVPAVVEPEGYLINQILQGI